MLNLQEIITILNKIANVKAHMINIKDKYREVNK